jgi:hypothetical protein
VQALKKEQDQQQVEQLQEQLADEESKVQAAADALEATQAQLTDSEMLQKLFTEQRELLQKLFREKKESEERRAGFAGYFAVVLVAFLAFLVLIVAAAVLPAA